MAQLPWQHSPGPTVLIPQLSPGPKVENNCTQEFLISGFRRLGLIEINKLAWSNITLV